MRRFTVRVSVQVALTLSDLEQREAEEARREELEADLERSRGGKFRVLPALGKVASPLKSVFTRSNSWSAKRSALRNSFGSRSEGANGAATARGRSEGGARAESEKAERRGSSGWGWRPLSARPAAERRCRRASGQR